MNEKIELSPEEKEFKREQHIILSMVINGATLDRFCQSAKVIAQEFIPLNADDRAAKLEELKEFAPVTPSARTMRRKFERMFPGTVEWGGWKP